MDVQIENALVTLIIFLAAFLRFGAALLLLPPPVVKTALRTYMLDGMLDSMLFYPPLLFIILPVTAAILV